MKRILALITVIILLVLSLSACSKKTERATVYYYYYSACSSCEDGKKFLQQAREAIGFEADLTDYQFILVNTFKESNPESLQNLAAQHGLEMEKLSYPLLFSSNGYLSGEEKIESELEIFLLSALTSNETKKEPLKTAGEYENADSGTSGKSLPVISQNSSYIVYFSTVSCHDCKRVKDYFTTLPKKIKIESFDDTVESEIGIVEYPIIKKENLKLLDTFFEFYQVPPEDRQVPIVFYTAGYLSGYGEIHTRLEMEMKKGNALSFSYPSSEKTFQHLDPIQLPGYFIVGMINGVNPCGISMVLLLLSLITVKKNNILKLGFSFLAGKVIAYVLIGIASFQMIRLIQSATFSALHSCIYICLAVLAFVLAFLYFRDAYWSFKHEYGRIRMQLPKRLRNWNQKFISSKIRQTETIGMFVLLAGMGFALSLGEFLCTGQVYAATILHLLQQSNEFNVLTVSVLFFFILGLMLPATVVIVLVYRGRTVFNLSEYFRRHLTLIKILYAILFFVFGIFTFFSFEQVGKICLNAKKVL